MTIERNSLKREEAKETLLKQIVREEATWFLRWKIRFNPDVWSEA
jgi:hypothetical protein